MQNSKLYLPSDRLRDVIEDNNLMILVISRFSIPFGFGDATVGEVCRKNGVDINTFLEVSNLIANDKLSDHKISLPSLMGYLRKAHKYFLDFNLPQIRKKLIEAINCTEVTDVAFLIIKYYDDYVEEVRKHMEFENDNVFPYIERLIFRENPGDFCLEEYSRHHTDMAERLAELKDIVIRHYELKDNDMLNSVLYDLISCEHDLINHCRVEDEILFPAAQREELHYSEHTQQQEEETADADTGEPGKLCQISEREKEVICHVARGLQNKEIADKMCLSIHTVTTYRRNIAQKLQIHSPAGLTIFAILHNLIDIREIKLQ